MATLRELGWVEGVNRNRTVNGKPVGTSNLWRFRIPDDLRDEIEAAEDAARARKAARRPPSPKPSRGGLRPPYGPTRPGPSVPPTSPSPTKTPPEPPPGSPAASSPPPSNAPR
jgi:hypothetical protein